MSQRHDANVRKLAVMALQKKGVSVESLSVEEIQDLKLPSIIVASLLEVKKERQTFTVEDAKAECAEIRSQSDIEVIEVPHYDPKVEIAEIVAPYVAPKVEEVESEEIVITETPEMYDESVLREKFAEHPTVTNANTLLKKVLASVDDSALVDQELAVKLSKEYAASNKAAK